PSASFFAGHDVLSYEWVDENTMKARVVIDTLPLDQKLLSLLYPYHFDKQAWENIMSQEKLILDSLPLGILDSLSSTDTTTTLLYVGHPSPHLKELNL